MEPINYEEEVKKIRPDAICYFNDLLSCWFVKSSEFGYVYYGESYVGRNEAIGENEAWQNAYNNLKDKI